MRGQDHDDFGSTESKIIVISLNLTKWLTPQ